MTDLDHEEFARLDGEEDGDANALRTVEATESPSKLNEEDLAIFKACLAKGITMQKATDALSYIINKGVGKMPRGMPRPLSSAALDAVIQYLQDTGETCTDKSLRSELAKRRGRLQEAFLDVNAGEENNAAMDFLGSNRG